jgi:hypothetical protein
LSGRGSLEAADLGEEGGEAMTTTTIREDTTINLSSDKEKGGQQLLWT